MEQTSSGLFRWVKCSETDSLIGMKIGRSDMFQPIHVIYDGQSAFCIRSLQLFRALDIKQVFRFYDAHDEWIMDAFPELKDADFTMRCLPSRKTGRFIGASLHSDV